MQGLAEALCVWILEIFVSEAIDIAMIHWYFAVSIKVERVY